MKGFQKRCSLQTTDIFGYFGMGRGSVLGTYPILNDVATRLAFSQQMIALVERYLMMAVPLDVRNLRGIGFRDGACLQTRAVPFSFHCIFFLQRCWKTRSFWTVALLMPCWEKAEHHACCRCVVVFTCVTSCHPKLWFLRKQADFSKLEIGEFSRFNQISWSFCGGLMIYLSMIGNLTMRQPSSKRIRSAKELGRYVEHANRKTVPWKFNMTPENTQKGE